MASDVIPMLFLEDKNGFSFRGRQKNTKVEIII